MMVKVADKNQSDPVTTYHEKKIGKTLYRVTSIYMGQFELSKALEDLTVKKILRHKNTAALFDTSKGETNVNAKKNL